MSTQNFVVVTLINGEQQQEIKVEVGANLREVLLDVGFSPYTALTRRLNCGGRGLCATCGVWIDNGDPAPEHWHDRIGARFGYPRLSCQITVTKSMTVRLVTDKWVWGSPDKDHRWIR